MLIEITIAILLVPGERGAFLGYLSDRNELYFVQCGFAHFRLEVEDNTPIVYLYEIQLTPEAQVSHLRSRGWPSKRE